MSLSLREEEVLGKLVNYSKCFGELADGVRMLSRDLKKTLQTLSSKGFIRKNRLTSNYTITKTGREALREARERAERADLRRGR